MNPYPAKIAATHTPSSSSRATSAKPVPTELRAKLEAGASCWWDEGGALHGCEALGPLFEYILAHQNKSTVDGCLSAIADKAPAIRVMAAQCLYRVHTRSDVREVNVSRAQTFDVVLAAMQKETEKGVRGALAVGIGELDATPAQRVDAVVALLEQLDAASEGVAMAFLLDTLSPTTGKDEPRERAVTLAISYTSSPHPELRGAAYALLGNAPSRGGESCPILAQAIEKDVAWGTALDALIGIGRPCLRQTAAVTRSLVKRIDFAANARHLSDSDISWLELSRYVAAEIVTNEQRELVAKAAERFARSPKTRERNRPNAQRVADEARRIGASR